MDETKRKRTEHIHKITKDTVETLREMLRHQSEIVAEIKNKVKGTAPHS